MRTELTQGYKLFLPAGNLMPLIFDSPHSGMEFPADFRCLASDVQLRSGWDAFVDELWQPAHLAGATLIAARASRMYIDLNRAVDDIDPELLSGDWPGELKPTTYSKRGMGLLRRFALPGVPMYEQKLAVSEVQQRIAQYYLPYHHCLSEQISALHQKFGAVWHIDCHSMKSQGNAMNIDQGRARADIVIGDKDGQSAEPGFTSLIVQFFQDRGYSVSVNYPYKGGYLTECFAAPAQQIHSVQIEINRALYMNEQTFMKHQGFNKLQHDLQQLVAAIRTYITQRLPALADEVN